ncbi:MAG: glutamyl-tRNA reductase [Clostridiales bacterium]
MNIFVTGINYKTIPTEIKNNINVTDDKQKEILTIIKKINSVEECILVSSVNILEVYIFSGHKDLDISQLEEVLCNSFEIDIYENRKNFYFYSGLDSVKHLFTLSCDLNSMILAENKITEQIKHAYFLAKENNFIDIILNKLFIEAISISKKVQIATSILSNSSSIASLSIKHLIDKYGESLKDKNILIIGTEKTGLIILNNFKEHSFNNIFITDKSGKNFDELDMSKSKFHITPYNDRYLSIDESDIIISSTSSPDYTLTKDLFEKNIKNNKPRLIMDLSNSNDIDKSIANFDSVEYMNTKQLEKIAKSKWNIGEIESIKSEVIVDKHVYEFGKWYEFRNFLPMLKNIQHIANEIIDKKTEECYANFTKLSTDNQVLVKDGIKRSVYEIINTFIEKIKTLEDTDNAKDYFSNLTEFFKDSKI